jgi:Nucleotidyl transferase AbiEii toxin, Type IV TA system
MDEILAAGAARGEAPAVAIRHHLLEGLLRRLARSEHAAVLVLRGGLMTRLWSPGRSTRDLDLVGDFPFSLDDAVARVRAAFTPEVDDGLRVLATRAAGIWLDSGFPGVRASVTVACGGVEEVVTADVGFGDPLVPPAIRFVYPALLASPPAEVRAIRPETQVAWKLHGLAEFGARFRPKDVADLHRLAAVPLDPDDLTEAIRAAFVSRGFPLSDAVEALDRAHLRTKTARVRFREAGHAAPLDGVLLAVRSALWPALERLR